MSSKPKAQTTKSTVTLPSFVAPEYKYASNELAQFYNKPQYQEQYAGNLYTDLSPQTQQALEMTQQRAMAGNPLLQQGSAEYSKTLAGDYLNPESNPYLQSTIDIANQSVSRNFANTVVPSLQGTFSKSGRYGSGMQGNVFNEAARNLGQQTSNNAMQLAGENYSRERTNQLQAMMNAPQYAQADYADIAKLGQVGQAYDAQEAKKLQSDLTKFYGARDAKGQALDAYINRIKNLTPGVNTTQTTSGGGGSMMGNVLGLAATGAGMYFGGPAGGAAAGSLFGASGLGGSTPQSSTGQTYLPWLNSGQGGWGSV